MERFKKWQQQNDSPKKRVRALLLGILIFPTLIPAIMIFLLPRLDHKLGLTSFAHGLATTLPGVLLIVLGGVLALWTIYIQVSLAAGTPFPTLPTQKLLILGPFKWCRNPMTLGTILAYGGVAVLLGSISGLIFVAVLAALLITYLKTIEEKELAFRFGEKYLAYKRSTPFILPNLFKK